MMAAEEELAEDAVAMEAMAVRLVAPLLGHRASMEEQRAAAKQLRLLARGDDRSRAAVADAGAIEALLPLLHSQDADMQENAITTLLNLSVNPLVRVRITQTEGALDGILQLLSYGLSVAAKENAAATVFSLLIVEDYREEVGKHPLAIPALLELLHSAPTYRGRKDAIKGLFHLSLLNANKPRIVAKGGVPLLVSTTLQKRSGLVDESLSVLAALALCEEGANAIVESHVLSDLVEILSSGSPRSRENALAVLLALCQGGDAQVFDRVAFYNHQIVSTLCSLLVIGSDRAKRKAKELMSILVVSNISSDSRSSSFQQRSSMAGFDKSDPSARP